MKPLSLKMRAIGLLSQREHSAAELRRKLKRIALAAATARASGVDNPDQALGGGDGHAGRVEVENVAAEVDELLAWLVAQGYLCEQRFVESRIHTRARRHGNLRIKQELAQHGLSLDGEQLAQLQDSEMERCRGVWLRKFGAPPETAAEWAKQTRFLAGRGFSAEIIRQVLRDPVD